MTFILNDFDDTRKFFVYVDITDDSVPYYAGYGTLSRLLRAARGNAKHKNIRKKHGQKRLVLFELDDETSAKELEKQVIADAQLNVYRHPENHFACNFTDGGEGTTGNKHTEATREKLRKVDHAWVRGERNPLKNPDVAAKVSKSRMGIPSHWKGKTLSLEHRQKIAASKTTYEESKCKQTVK